MTSPLIQRLQQNWTLVLVASALVLSISMGVRQTFGLVMVPMLDALDTGRQTFSVAMAIQNLLWGVAQPIAGMIADKYGSARVLLGGTVVYIAGLWVMGTAETVFGLHMGGGVLIGIAVSGTAFAVVLGAVGRLVPAHKRGMALGLASAGGSLGQFAMPLIAQPLIAELGWSGALLSMIFIAGLMAPFSVILVGNASQKGAHASPTLEGEPDSITAAMREAFIHRGYWYLTIGFFVCGFQVVFIAIHLPAYITDMGLSPSLGAVALGFIGFFNIIGSWGCGYLGDKFSKKWLLSWMYVGRSLFTAAFLFAPKTDLTVLMFAAGMGLLWLGTVPLTSGLIAQIFGPRYMTTLFGVIFFSHQLGSFAGVWIAGWAYDTTGSYDIIWYAAIGTGFIAAFFHLPIVESALRGEEQPIVEPATS